MVGLSPSTPSRRLRAKDRQHWTPHVGGWGAPGILRYKKLWSRTDAIAGLCRKVIHMPDREAACSCGQLQVTVRGDPVRVAMCHCLECQRRTGSTFGVQAFYPRDQVRLAKGIAKRYARRAESGRTVRFNFCPECGGTVFWEPEQRPELIAVAVGTFADPDFEKPLNSVWEKRQHPWTTAIAEQQIEHSD